MMASKIIVLVTVVAACNAVPWNYRGDVVVPDEFYYRNARSPAISYGFGSGFSSTVGGITHSTGIGSSYSSGGERAYGSGFGASDSNGYARGVGIASSGNNYPVQQQYQPAYNTAPRTTYVAPVPTASNYGNFGNAVSSASLVGGSAVSSAQTIGQGGINSAVSSAQNAPGYRAAVSSANTYGTPVAAVRNNDFGSSLSSAQAIGDGYAVSAAENINGVRASTAQAVQQRGGSIQNSGATSINGNGFQAAHSHAVNTGYY